MISSTGYRLAATTVNGQAVADILEGTHDVEVVDFSGMLRTQQGDQDLSHCLPAAITHNLRSLSLARSGVVCDRQFHRWLAGTASEPGALARLERLEIGWPSASKCTLCMLVGQQHQVTDRTLQGLAQQCRQLRALGLAGTQVTDAGLQALLAGCRQLQVIDVQSCRSISRSVRTAAHKASQSGSMAELKAVLGM